MEMDSLTKNRKSRAVIDMMARKCFDGIGLHESADAVTELKEGWFNVAYNIKLSTGKETILKIAPPKASDILTYEKGIMNTEVNMMRLIRSKTQVKVPEIYYYDESKELCDADYFFMEKLRGNNYGNIKSGLSEETNKNIHLQKGQYLRMMNELEGTFFGYEGNPDIRGDNWRETFIKMIDYVLYDAVRKNVDIGYSCVEVRELITKYAPCLDAVTKPHFVHWDAWDHNIFAEKDELTGVIDFERALWGDYLIESLFRTMIPEELEGYGKTSFTPEETLRCKLYDAYLYLIAVIECEYRHYDTDENYIKSMMLLSETLEWLTKHN